MNCRIHPTKNRATGTGHSPWIKMERTNSGSESAIIGMPKEWQTRFTGCWWLEAYCATHCSLVRLPSMAGIISLLGPGALKSVEDRQQLLNGHGRVLQVVIHRDANRFHGRIKPVPLRRHHEAHTASRQNDRPLVAEGDHSCTSLPQDYGAERVPKCHRRAFSCRSRLPIDENVNLSFVGML